ncbi:MAG: LPXTG cell wall anchor domain-containing protein [Actinomycetota bacterium]
MTRKMLVAIAAVAMLFIGFGATSPDASADYDCGDPYILPYFLPGTISNCAPAHVYPGQFTNHPPAPTGPYGWGSLNITAGAAAAGTGGGDAGAALAHTGSESTVIAYVGTGLIAFGAVALGSRRKFFQGALD